MLQHDGDKTALGLETQRNGIPRGDRDALLEAKDRTIAELKEQVALLRRELTHKDAILSRMTEGTGGLLPARASKAADGPRPVTPGGGRRDGGRAANARPKQEKPTLPDGYRVVAIASDAWVLVAPRGLRVAGYRDELDLRKVVLDAREHHQRE